MGREREKGDENAENDALSGIVWMRVSDGWMGNRVACLLAKWLNGRADGIANDEARAISMNERGKLDGCRREEPRTTTALLSPSRIVSRCLTFLAREKRERAGSGRNGTRNPIFGEIERAQRPSGRGRNIDVLASGFRPREARFPGLTLSAEKRRVLRITTADDESASSVHIYQALVSMLVIMVDGVDVIVL